MKIYHIAAAFTCCIFAVIGCKKSLPTRDPGARFVEQAKEFFNKEIAEISANDTTNPFSKLNKQVDWDNMSVDSMSVGPVIVLPLHFEEPLFERSSYGNTKYSIDQLAKVIIYQDHEKRFHEEVLLSVPDSIGLSSGFYSGTIIVCDWRFNVITGLRFSNGTIYGASPDLSPFQRNPASDGDAKKIPAETYTIPVCTTIDWYSCTDECTYLYSTQTCYNINVSTPSGGLSATEYGSVAGGGGGVVDGNSNVYYQFPADISGIALADYFNCFNNIPDDLTTYSVSICADVPDNSNPSYLISGTYAGHAFIVLSKSSQGKSYTLSFGFYPNNRYLSVTGSQVGGHVNDDGVSQHEYNASLAMNNLTAVQFNTVLSTALTKSANLYQLCGSSSYNCTNYALDVFNSVRMGSDGPIVVPDWYGQFTDFDFGKTPSGLYYVLENTPGSQIGVFKAPTTAGPCVTVE
jgi:hypothetical protein